MQHIGKLATTFGVILGSLIVIIMLEPAVAAVLVAIFDDTLASSQGPTRLFLVVLELLLTNPVLMVEALLGWAVISIWAVWTQVVRIS